MELQEDSASMYRKTKILNLFRNKLVGDLIHHLKGYLLTRRYVLLLYVLCMLN